MEDSSGDTKKPALGCRTNASRSQPSGADQAQSDPCSSASTLDKLGKDYAQISRLMSEMDHLLKGFATNMEDIVESVPAHDALSAQWESYSIRPQTKATTKSGTADDGAKSSDLPLGDEDGDPNDEILFL